jgi:hypothetical protein
MHSCLGGRACRCGACVQNCRYRWETGRLRVQERMRWLREQADMALVAEDAVRLALQFLLTKDGQKAVKEAKATLKVGVATH